MAQVTFLLPEKKDEKYLLITNYYLLFFFCGVAADCNFDYPSRPPLS